MDDPITLKANKGKAITELSVSFDEEKNDAKASLSVKGFQTFLKSKERQKCPRSIETIQQECK